LRKSLRSLRLKTTTPFLNYSQTIMQTNLGLTR